jgi:hypothetical protein
MLIVEFYFFHVVHCNMKGIFILKGSTMADYKKEKYEGNGQNGRREEYGKQGFGKNNGNQRAEPKGQRPMKQEDFEQPEERGQKNKRNGGNKW